MSEKPTRSFVPFLAGCLAPLATAGAFLALAGEASLARIQSLGTIGTVVGLVVFSLTVVLPCGMLGLLGSSTGLLSAFGRGLLIPLGILAFAGADLLAGGRSEPLPAPTAEMVVAEAFLAVWRPGDHHVTATPAVVERADASSDALEELQDRLRLVSAERNALTERLRQVRSVERIEMPEDAEARAARAKAVEARLREVEARLERVRETEENLRGKLQAADEGLLSARREADEMRAAMMKAREEAIVARDEAKFEREKLLAQIEDLSDSALRRELRDLRSRAFVPVGVVYEIQKTSRGRGLAIRTGVDASTVAGPAFLVSPSGKIIAVLRCGAGKGEALAATVLYFAPGAKATPGDRVFAHVR